MKFSTGHYFVILVGIASIFTKYFLDRPIYYDDMRPLIKNNIQRTLIDSRFIILNESFNFDIAAIRNDCFLVIGPSRPEGGGDSAFQESYRAVGEVRFLYRGTIYTSRPTNLALYDRYWERLKMAIGRKPGLFTLYHFAASATCDPKEISNLNIDLNL